VVIPDGGGGSFEGINPELLAQLMRSLSSGANNGQQVAGGYVWQFQRLGLDTGALTKLQQDYSWASGQNSMLQRRYNLASNQPSGDWEEGFATAGAGYLQCTSPGQAQAAGAQATKDYKDGRISYEQYMALYAQNKGDPDWSTGAVKALGSEGLNELEYRMRDAYPPDTSAWQALAVAVAAAMSNGVTFPYSGDIDHKGTENLQLLDPLLPYANFPASVLVTLGNEVTYGGPNSSSVYAGNVLNALAANPEAAAQFMVQFQSTHGVSLEQYVALGSDHHGMMPTDEAKQFANVITAGTVGAKNVDPKLAAANVTGLVQFYSDHPGTHTYGPIEGAYGNIIKGLWPDVMFAITSTAPGATQKGLGPDGMPLSPEQWAAFTDEAMRDPGTAAMLMELAHTQAKQWQTTAAQQSGQNAGDAYAFQAGLVNGFFDSQAQTVYKSLGSDGGSWKDKVADHIGDAVDMTFDIVADPGAAAKTVAVDVSKVAIEEIGKAFVGAIPTDGSTPPKPDYSSWQSSFEWQIRQDYDNSPGHTQGNPGLAALVNSAKNYDGGSFVQDGQIIDPSKMTPQQLQAYNAWLDSPTVINYVENGGQGTSYRDGYQTWVTQNSFNGGG
jgi:hypothetical protein